MVLAMRALPVRFTGVSPMNRSNSVPLSTVGWPGLVTAHTGVFHSPRPPSMPPAARPLMKVRREVLHCMPFQSSQSKEAPRNLSGARFECKTAISGTGR
ncbi:hypothetical protein FQZ97_1017960 [compost metagenome]